MLAGGEVNRKGAVAKASPNRASSRRPQTRSRVSYPWAGGSGGKTPWRAERKWVENRSDDLGIGVKGLSNPEISRSPRNSFRAGPGTFTIGGRALDRRGGLTAYRPRPNSECRWFYPGSQSAWAKLRAREGNSPDRPLRSPNPRRVAKDVRSRRQPGGWLRSSHPFKECVTAHWSSGRAPTIHGAKRGTEAAG